MNNVNSPNGQGGFNTVEFMKNIKSDRIHFLDTPAGRKWENIVSWRIAQKENKKVSRLNIDVISVLTQGERRA